MTPQTFAELIAMGAIERVRLQRPTEDAFWEVHAHGAGVPSDTGNALQLDGSSAKRSWADLDSAYTFIRRAGFTGTIEIGPAAGEPAGPAASNLSDPAKNRPAQQRQVERRRVPREK